MRQLHIAFLFCTFVGVVSATQPNDDHVVSRAVSHLDALTLITKEPHEMLDSTIMLCAPAGSRPHNPHEGSHQSVFCNVYSNTRGVETLRSGVGDYQEGSMIVKSKLRGRNAKDIELFTVMRKMEPGYDRDHGDWEYSVVDGKTHRVLSRGRIDSCIACHSDYQKTDYVTRTYFDRK